VTPTYWYVTANNRIASIGTLQEAQAQSVFTFMIIVFGFGLLFFILSSLAGRRARRN